MNFFKLSLTGCVMLAAANLSALDLGCEINLSGGYRNDEITANNTIRRPESTTSKDRLTLGNINIGEVGFDFRFTLPECDFCCQSPFTRNFYLDGYAYWGWSENENFDRFTYGITPAGAITSTTSSHGSFKARTEDFQIGLGYLLLNRDCWAWGISGGYAYDWERISTSRGSSSTDNGPFIDDDLYDGLAFKQSWEGPWIGTEIFYETCGCLLNVGYEYHFANYHANFDIPNNEVAQANDFSDTRKGHNGYGNVAFINAHYKMCDCWNVGLGFTYKRFNSSHARMSPADGSFEDNGFPDGTTGSANSVWTSYSILVDLGYSF